MELQLLVQFLVLGLTAYVWWRARRDLALKGSQIYEPHVEEWERLQLAVQGLIAEVERRATEVEFRVDATERRFVETEARLKQTLSQTVNSLPEHWDTTGKTVSSLETSGTVPAERSYAEAENTAHDERYAPVYALVTAGLTDAGEIARRTGLGRGEVELILGLHARQRLD